jgi:hypothetical protein
MLKNRTMATFSPFTARALPLNASSAEGFGQSPINGKATISNRPDGSVAKWANVILDIGIPHTSAAPSVLHNTPPSSSVAQSGLFFHNFAH